MGAERRIFTVSEVTARIKAALEDELGSVWIEGELSNVRRPSSGHYYFTIKDEATQISAVLFRGSQRSLSFVPKDGLLVRAFGQITVYARGGNYQILVRQMEEGGKGALQARFEALKAKLEADGLFAPERKKPMPMLPQHVGVVTSPTGAAIRDILNVVGRRFPNLHVLLAPVKVQGEGAAEQVAWAIDYLSGRGDMDVLIVGRGGGSIEDLWCFNEELVARAIARSRIPIISAVGHEIDFSISDFVADLRAATPSAAAELVVGRKDAFESRLAEVTGRLGRSLRQSALVVRNRLTTASGSYVFREPGNLVARHRQSLEGRETRARHAMRGGVRDGAQRLDELGMKLRHRLAVDHQARAQHVQRLAAQLSALDPMSVLGRGYSVTLDADGKVIRSAGQVQVGDTLDTTLAQGRLQSSVTRREDHGGEEDKG